MGKLSGKVRNAVTQRYADARFDEAEVARRSQGMHNNEPMSRVYQRIMSDPSIRQEETKTPHRYDLVYHSEGKPESVVGWIDHAKGMGEISQKAYDHLQELEQNGCYVVKEKDNYAIMAYTDELKGQYVIQNEDGYSFSETDRSVFAVYDDAVSASHGASMQLGLLPSYDAPENDLEDMPHSAEAGDGVYRAPILDEEQMEAVSDDLEMGE